MDQQRLTLTHTDTRISRGQRANTVNMFGVIVMLFVFKGNTYKRENVVDGLHSNSIFASKVIITLTCDA